MNNRAIGRSIIRILLLTCSMLVLPAFAQTAADGQNSIQALNVTLAPDGKVVLAVTLKNPLAAAPKNFSASNPARLLFDFPGTVNGLGKSLQEVNQGDVHNINIVQAGSRTRVVVNLAKMVAYDSRVEGNNVVITLKTLVAAKATSRFAEETPGARGGHALRKIEFHKGPNGEGRVEVTLSDPGVGIDLRQEGGRIIVDFLNTKAPRTLQQKLDVLDFATPVESFDTYAQGNNIRMAISPKGLWEHAAYQTDNMFVVEIKQRPPEEDKKDGKPIYSGTKLTLDVRNISIRDALSIIADFTGINIVITDSVAGSLTLRLKDVPWDQAMDIILQTKGLAQVRNGNVIQVMPAAELNTIIKVNSQQKAESEDYAELHTEAFQLSYQKGADMVALISNKDQRILSKRGSAVVDARTNTLFVKDTPSALDEVRRLIRQVDVPVRQVMIEARFVAAGEQFNRTLGGRLGYTNNGPFHAGGGQLGTATSNVNLPGNTSGNGGLAFTLFNPTNTKTLQLELYASEIDGTTKNIASPRVVTADNIPATVLSGTQVPYQQATSSGATSIAFQPATLSLAVTPKITPDDHVSMVLSVSRDTVGTIYSGVPSINTQKVTTTVTVENGGTVAIGGVFTKDYTATDTKVPLLGDIPIIGWFFKQNVVQDQQNELLLFITPKILKDSLIMN